MSVESPIEVTLLMGFGYVLRLTGTNAVYNPRTLRWRDYTGTRGHSPYLSMKQACRAAEHLTKDYHSRKGLPHGPA